MGSDQKLVNLLLSKLSVTFKICDLGAPSFFLDIETIREYGGMLLSQRRYMTDILRHTGMADCKPLATSILVSRVVPVSESTELYDDPTQYRSLAGALQYLTITRPDLSFAMNQLCTIDFGLHIRKFVTNDLHAFSNSDWARCPEDRKSTSGFAVFLGSNLVSWTLARRNSETKSSMKKIKKSEKNNFIALQSLTSVQEYNNI
ncbi:PREDICTED: uncharacterized protein LOC109190918 [Ipomoea nil]|uniref:uncharacterized protein LOC109190918 n=1 Tax=Ipomoea nil TaxID=35883 RepID=UPI000901466A|nr:PREDICTED: uncharacterized protein LOC109190918 [Ipomoea nil]